MKGAIIGFGVIAEGHYFAYNSINELDIVAVLDTNTDRRYIAQQMIPGVHCYEDFDVLCTSEHLDFIDVCTPPYCRFGYMLKALKNGYHVIGEKPFIFSKEEYATLISEAIKNNVLLYPSHNYKFAPVVRLTKSKICNDSFGKIINGHYKTYRIGHAKGNAEWNPNWRRYPEYSGGGILWDHGPHSIYMSCYFMEQWPIAVSCIAGAFSKQPYTTEDTVLLTLYFKDNVRIDILLTWASSVRETYYYIYGEKGTILIEDNIIKHIDSLGKEHLLEIESEFDDPKHKSWFIGVLNDFYKSVCTSEQRVDLLKESYITVAAIEAAYHSSNKGGVKIPIQLPQWFSK